MPPALIGRTDELATASDRLVRDGLVVLTGASGIGKTALATAIADSHAGAGGSARIVRGTVGLAQIPFGALAPFAGGSVSPTEAVTAISAGLAGSADLLLVVDDAHLLDEASAGFLVGLIVGRTAKVLMTMTSGEPPPPDLDGLLTRRPDARIELQPLGPTDTAAVARRRLGREPTTAELDRIVGLSLGYPLYIEAIAEGITEGATPGPTDRAAAILRHRLGRTTAAERDLFDLFVLGAPLPLGVIRPHERSTLDSLVARHYLTRTGGGLDIGHPFLGALARELMGAPQRRRAAGELLDRADDLDDVALVRVTSAARDLGVDLPDAVRRRAVAASVALGDHALAVELTAADPTDPVLAPLRARALRHLNAIPEPPPPGLSESELVAYLSQQAQALAFVEQRFGEALEVLSTGLDLVVDPGGRDRIALELLTLSGLVGDMDSLLLAGRSVGQEADDDTRLLAEVTIHLAEALTLTTEASDLTYGRARSLVDAGAGDELMAERLELCRAFVALAEGRFDQARVAFGRHHLTPGMWLTVESLLADVWSTPELALAVAERAIEVLRGSDPFGNLSQARALAAQRKAQMGVDVALGPEPLGSPDTSTIDLVMLRRVEAWTDWRTDPAGAAQTLAEAGRIAVAASHRLWGLCCLLDATRLGAGPAVAADLDQLTITRGAGLARLASLHARASTREQRLHSARAWWEAGAPVLAIEVVVASDDPLLAAVAQLLSRRGAQPLVGTVPDGPLTRRQLDVLEASLAGSTNAEVADRLFLSRRTVENHLHAAYRAVGATREELDRIAGWLGARDLTPADAGTTPVAG